MKYKQFSHLRESEEQPMDLSPVKSESLELIKEMIDQILKLHPQINYLHIGEFITFPLSKRPTRLFFANFFGDFVFFLFFFFIGVPSFKFNQ